MIQLENVSKQFGNLHVLEKLNVTIQPQEVTAIVGHNGSGKTTLIKIILGLIKADAGNIVINGQNINETPTYREAIGYMSQIGRFPENLTPNEVMAMLKDLRSNQKETDEELFDAWNLATEMEKPFRNLSGGNKQKINAYLALLFQPEILILDEPSAGLDPLASSILKDKIMQLKQTGKTIILTSHIMSDIEELADRVVLLNDGKIKVDDKLTALREMTGKQSLERAIASIMKTATVTA